MALTLRAQPAPEVTIFPARSEPPLEADPRGGLDRLAVLHDEARETALLGNLLGRAPYVAAVLTSFMFGVLLLGLGTISIFEQSVWAALMLVGIAAIIRTYTAATRKPFALGPLREFAADFRAIVLYCGIAWGIGAFLAIGPQSSSLGLLGFSAGAAIVMALVLRTQEIVLVFVAPVAGLTVLAAALRPFPGGALSAAFVLIACAAVAGAIIWADRYSEPVPVAAKLSDFQFS